MSTDNGDTRWSQLLQLAEKEHIPEKLYAIVQELCVELAALDKQLIMAKTQVLKRRREARRQRDRLRDACN
jgi:hypothetical protein